MNRLISILILTILSISAFSQKLKIDSFNEKPTDLSARANPRTDANDTPCALIKVQVALTGVKFEGNVIGEVNRNVSEYWVYMSAGTKRLKVMHPDYLNTEVVFADYGIKSLVSKTTYELILSKPAQTEQSSATSSTSVSSQYLMFQVDPKDAMIEVNGDTWVNNEGTAVKLVPFGSYSYSVQCGNYHTSTGTATVNDPANKTVVTVKLKPAFGTVSIPSTNDLQGAIAYIDNNRVGTVPLNAEKIPSGSHTLKLVKEMYRTYEQTITVTDGQVTKVSPSLSANFATVTLTAPDNAEIWVNGEQKGTGTWTGRLEYGEYKIETRKTSHQTQSRVYTITKDKSTHNIALTAPTPFYGSINISSMPYGSTILLDGKNVGETPLLLSQVLIGSHKVQLSKEGYTASEQQVNVENGKMTEISTNLKEGDVRAVDLGLSVKWASCNVGANKPEEYGDYFAWGETKPKAEYTWSNLKYCTAFNGTRFIKYVTSKSPGEKNDNNTILDPEDDAAHVNWGGSWRMPTIAELEELRTKCTWTWTTQNGVNGCKVTSKTNGNSIFLPAAGIFSSTDYVNLGSYGYYWSSSLNSNFWCDAFFENFYSTGVNRDSGGRCCGRSVRAVCP